MKQWDAGNSFLHDSTEMSGAISARGSADIRLPGLTVLYHPDLERVGERTILSELAAGRPARLSRLEPRFAAPAGAREPRPLTHRRLSRQPVIFEAAGDGVRLCRGESRTRVVIEGEDLGDERTFSAEAIDEGVVLLLGDRVVLFFHRLQAVADRSVPRFDLVGESPEILSLRHLLARVADLDAPVLLRGESGTGKELAARAIHRASGRSGPLVAVNMAAVPSSLAAAELFGAARGAFTGADAKRPGYFSRADGGTLFLDEIGETPVEVQASLLRALETGEIQPVGAEAPRRVDVRLVAATDTDLETAVESGSFRAPLFHRLSGFQIFLPPLRERREDFGRLLVEFLRRELEEVGEARRLQSDPPWLGAEIVARLASESWPGNVRQLRNVVRQVVIAHRGEEHAGLDPALEALLDPGRAASEKTGPETRDPGSRSLGRATFRQAADVGEDELFAALAENAWRPRDAARALGVSSGTLYRLIEKSPRLRKASELERTDIEAALAEGGGVHAASRRLRVSPRGLSRRMRELGLG